MELNSAVKPGEFGSPKKKSAKLGGWAPYDRYKWRDMGPLISRVVITPVIQPIYKVSLIGVFNFIYNDRRGPPCWRMGDEVRCPRPGVAWRIIPFSRPVLIAMVIVSPLSGVVGPLPNGLFMAYK